MMSDQKTPTNKPINFVGVEALREHLMLTTMHMAKVLDTTRVTYASWVAGKPMRGGNKDKVTAKLRVLFRVVKEGGWPSDAVKAMTSAQRVDTLLEEIKKYE